MKKTYTISVNWGRSCTYHPFSTPKINWDGILDVKDGKVLYIDKLTYKFIAWSQAHEVANHIYDCNWPLALRTVGSYMAWKSDAEPGDPGSLEGLRFDVEGNEDTLITLDMVPIKVQFKLGELLEKEYLRYHVGKKYAGNVVAVFLGKDARKRVSREQHLRLLSQTSKPGYLIMPDDFTDAPKGYHHSMYGAKLEPNKKICAKFPIVNYASSNCDTYPVQIQVSGILPYTEKLAEALVSFKVDIGSYSDTIVWQFTNRACMPKLEDIYINLPQSVLSAEDNQITITYISGDITLLFHRVYINKNRPTLAYRLKEMPPLPNERTIHVGTETDMLTPANGDIDELIEILHDEEIGDYILFRERAASASDEEVSRWSEKVKEYKFICGTSGSERPRAEQLFEELLGSQYLGVQEHEISNLAYGWGLADPMEIRKNRTLPECKESYLKRMNARMVGQAIPQQHLDYEAGVETIITEIPGSHSTLMLSGARGAANAYDKKRWGVHLANHVQKIPLDEDTARRLFIVSTSSWLFGAEIISDEEVAFRYNHDTTYAYSDELPTAYRKVYQDLYHYSNNINLGKEIVQTGFLHGNYDLLVGGTVAGPYISKPKFWGEFGPESEGWDYDTPESGWKLIDNYLPGVHLNPISQNVDDIRIFFSGTPNGQVDLVPITIGVDKLSKYKVLFLPGWNTMTNELYEQLIEYVRGGGHLILCAAQCTKHVTRSFLVEKKDFNFINDGDLTALAGIKVYEPSGIVTAVRYCDEEIYTDPGVPGLKVELSGAKVLATDQSGKPVIVENTIGEGKVWMLTLGEYWGHDALESLRKAICRRVVDENPASIRISGNNEVEFHHYDCGDFERVVLLNTDWTSAGNVKHITLHTNTLHIPLKVFEGKTNHVLLSGDFAVNFYVPSALVDGLKVSDKQATFKLQGFGKTSVQLFSKEQITSIMVDGKQYQLDGNTLSVNMGENWSNCKVTVNFI